MQLKVLHKYL